jgi:hypothetical protein
MAKRILVRKTKPKDKVKGKKKMLVVRKKNINRSQITKVRVNIKNAPPTATATFGQAPNIVVNTPDNTAALMTLLSGMAQPPPPPQLTPASEATPPPVQTPGPAVESSDSSISSGFGVDVPIEVGPRVPNSTLVFNQFEPAPDPWSVVVRNATTATQTNPTPILQNTGMSTINVPETQIDTSYRTNLEERYRAAMEESYRSAMEVEPPVETSNSAMQTMRIKTKKKSTQTEPFEQPFVPQLLEFAAPSTPPKAAGSDTSSMDIDPMEKLSPGLRSKVQLIVEPIMQELQGLRAGFGDPQSALRDIAQTQISLQQQYLGNREDQAQLRQMFTELKRQISQPHVRSPPKFNESALVLLPPGVVNNTPWKPNMSMFDIPMTPVMTPATPIETNFIPPVLGGVFAETTKDVNSRPKPEYVPNPAAEDFMKGTKLVFDTPAPAEPVIVNRYTSRELGAKLKGSKIYYKLKGETGKGKEVYHLQKQLDKIVKAEGEIPLNLERQIMDLFKGVREGVKGDLKIHKTINEEENAKRRNLRRKEYAAQAKRHLFEKKRMADL